MERARDGHWQDRWSRAGLAHAPAPSQAPKFYAIVAYPGASGFLHVGHLRGLSLADSLHRFHRMLGEAVFFPTGTHASGLPAVTFAQHVKDRDPLTTAQLEENGVPPETWGRLEDPAEAARFLGMSYLSVHRRLGFLIDERAYVTTIDDDYQAFIRWQFHRLRDLGLLVQAPHYASVCPVCGPVSVDPSETDLSSGGDAEWITYATVPFRLEDGRILLTATLRPETIFGVTNLWVNPNVPLTVWHHADQVFLVSKVAAHRLVEQHGGRVGHEVPVSEVLGRSVTVAVTQRKVPILASLLVDPGRGTGVVMSVPAHAPVDWLALQELTETERTGLGEIPEIVVVTRESATTASERALLEGDGVPAARAVRATGARSLSDQEPLEQATERLYRLEFVRGHMRHDLLGGVAVAEARELIAGRLRSEGSSYDLQEFSKPVICRNGHEVVIRRIPDQWFLRYSDPEWKASTEALVGRMVIRPREYQAELSGILDWYQDRPCTRRGRWLGTAFPIDPTWLIEPIADSTFYPAYFTVRPFVADGRIPVASLTDAFFDFVFLGRGEGEPSIPLATLNEVRRAFTYWYPLDANVGGKEHKRVHFPVFLFTHVKLVPPELQPRGIFVHWWITDKGGTKISKKDIAVGRSRIPPVRGALERWGADGLRLYLAQAASTDQDIEWDVAVVDSMAERLGDIERLVRQLLVPGSGGTPELERWLESEMHEVVRATRHAFNEFEFREAAEIVYARTPGLFRRYFHRGGVSGDSINRLARVWIRLLSPITPHMAEELGDGLFPELVATQPFPTTEELRSSPSDVEAEAFVQRVEEDLQNVLRPTEARGERPEAVTFFVAAPWKATIEQWLRSEMGTGSEPPLRALMERAKLHPELAAYLPEIPKYVQRVAAQVRAEGHRSPPAFDELGLLKSIEGYLARRFRVENVTVYPESAGEPHDPQHRRERARPGRPAFFVITRPSAANTGGTR